MSSPAAGNAAAAGKASGAAKAKRGGKEKGAKGGLRRFSMQVCRKVQEKAVTTYNEVADALVEDLSKDEEKAGFDQKNIRRRVYDALNVLMAMDIIAKEKKNIQWVGLPSNRAHEVGHLENDARCRRERIEKKRQHVQELIVQLIAVRNLVRRNRAHQEHLAATGGTESGSALRLPFIVVNTNKETEIECQMSEDSCHFFFNMDQAFEIHDDLEILKRLNLLGPGAGQLRGAGDGGNNEVARWGPEHVADLREHIPEDLHGYLDGVVASLQNGNEQK